MPPSTTSAGRVDASDADRKCDQLEEHRNTHTYHAYPCANFLGEACSCAPSQPCPSRHVDAPWLACITPQLEGWMEQGRTTRAENACSTRLIRSNRSAACTRRGKQKRHSTAWRRSVHSHEVQMAHISIHAGSLAVCSCNAGRAAT
jgi:hypothetical protein